MRIIYPEFINVVLELDERLTCKALYQLQILDYCKQLSMHNKLAGSDDTLGKNLKALCRHLDIYRDDTDKIVNKIVSQRNALAHLKRQFYLLGDYAQTIRDICDDIDIFILDVNAELETYIEVYNK